MQSIENTLESYRNSNPLSGSAGKGNLSQILAEAKETSLTLQNSHEKQSRRVQEILTSRKGSYAYMEPTRMLSGLTSNDSSLVKVSVINCHDQQKHRSGGSGETQVHESISGAEDNLNP